MSEPLNTDQLNLLARALRQKSFHFIIIGYDHPDIFPEISAWLHEHLPDRPIRELPVSDKTFQEIQNILIQADHDIVLIPDFDWFFKPENASVSVAFNQHRDFFARRKMTLLCFIQSLNFRLLPLKMPDLWSLRSLELEFKGTIQISTHNFSNINDAEKALLSIFAVLPAEPIALDVLDDLLPGSEHIDTALTALVAKGWIEHNTTSKNYKCNTLVQEAIRQQNNERLFDDCKYLIGTLIDKLDYDENFGHLTEISYNNAALYTRYGESVLQHISQTKELLAILAERLGSYHATTKNLDKALNFYQDETRLFQKLFSAFPDNVSFKNGLAIAYEKLGDINKALGNIDKTLAFYELYFQLRVVLFNAFPDNISFKYGLAISFSKLGDTNKALGNIDKALAFYELYSNLIKELHNAFPNNSSFKYELAVSYEKLGGAHSAIGNIDKALASHEQAQTFWAELPISSPDHTLFQPNLSLVKKSLPALLQS